MPRIEISLTGIEVVKGSDGKFPFSSNVDLFPCFKINSSRERRSGFGQKHEELAKGEHQLDDVWFDIDVPEGEFAEVGVQFFEADPNDSTSKAFRDAEIPALNSYLIPDLNLAAFVRATNGGTTVTLEDSHGNTTSTVFSGDKEKVLWFVILAKTIFDLADLNKDDFFGEWLLRIEAHPGKVLIASTGLDAQTARIPSDSPGISVLTEAGVTPLTRIEFKGGNSHIKYSLAARIKGK